MDRDTKFTEAFKTKLKDNDVQPHVLPARSPNMNPFMEQFMGMFKRELTYRMIFFGKSMLDHATKQFIVHYHGERPHQGLANELIIPLNDRLIGKARLKPISDLVDC